MRGCTVKDAHYATCEDLGSNGPGQCEGCAPRTARDGTLLCERCFRNIARLLGEAPDLVAHLRSLANPAKAARYDSVTVMTSKGDPPAPVSADLLDAGNNIIVTLQLWAYRIEHPDAETLPQFRLRAGTPGSTAAIQARQAASVVLSDLGRIANDSQQARTLGDAVLNSQRGNSAGPWSLAAVSARWPLTDAKRWAVAPCPSCDLKTVQVVPSSGSLHCYICRECGWEADSRSDGGLWGDVFAQADAAQGDAA